MPQALYRKYRPQTFSDLVGQNSIKITLESEIANNRIAHAYLFSGPRGIGKTTTARLMAKAANCPKRKGSEPCGKCDFCQEIASGRSMDLIEIDAASHTGVDNVRENIIENARFTPQRAKYKVFIIDEVHMLSVSAFNALLKTLEEPPGHVIFILATTEIHRVPETIISRCQRFDFKRVNVQDLIKRLKNICKNEDIKINDKILKDIALRAEGSVRDSEVLLSQIIAIGGSDITEEEASLVIPRSNINLVFELFNYIITSDSAASITLINKLVEEGVNLQDFNKEFIEFLRKVLLFKVSGTLNELSALALDEDLTKQLKSRIQNVKIGRLVKIIEKFNQKTREFKYAEISQLPLELAVLEITEINQEGQEKGVNIPDNPVSNVPGKPASRQAKSGEETAIKSIKFNSLEKKWTAIVEQLKQYNHSISVSLKVGLPIKVENDRLVIGFRYKFHADRIKEHKVRKMIEEVIEKVTGSKFKLSALVITEQEFAQRKKELYSSESQDSMWDQAIQVFGDDIVSG